MNSLGFSDGYSQVRFKRTSNSKFYTNNLLLITSNLLLSLFNRLLFTDIVLTTWVTKHKKNWPANPTKTDRHVYYDEWWVKLQHLFKSGSSAYNYLPWISLFVIKKTDFSKCYTKNHCFRQYFCYKLSSIR